jgi:hypothetical protein
MDLIAERDPLFARYEPAWRLFQVARAADSARAMPYEQAITVSADPGVRAAAHELAIARGLAL